MRYIKRSLTECVVLARLVTFLVHVHMYVSHEPISIVLLRFWSNTLLMAERGGLPRL